MNNISKTNKAILIAYKRGYRISKKGKLINPENKTVKCTVDIDGYVRTGIRISNKETTNIRIHKLAAFQKYGYRMFKKGIEARHLDGDKTNNEPNNIVIGTHSQNMMDIKPVNRIIRALKCVKNTRKLSPKQFELFKIDKNNGLSFSELAKKYNISKSSAARICNNQTYRHTDIMPNWECKSF